MTGKIRINNSLTGKLEEFDPINPGARDVNMYTCGVTVYDDCHIGHARSLYIFDVMRRYLEYRGFKVNFVRNITDIDDKIINRANELKVDWKDLVEKYIKSYRDNLKSLSIQSGMVDKDGEEPRATKSIEDIVKYIQALIEKGYAYATATGVYFSVRKFKDYGKLSGQGIDQMLTGVRKISDETKEDPLDFALWKTSKPGEPSWPSPWGDGRPGWHIECSVMSTKYLKTDTLDIHAGGMDLIFPHHENEIAQSEAKSGKQFARYWIHHGLLTINGQKMSKSSGNFITIDDILKKYNPDVLKLFFLSAHYASPIDFTWQKMEQFNNAYNNRFAELFNKLDWKFGNRGVMSGGLDTNNTDIANHVKKFEKAMDEDFNTPKAISVIFDLLTFSNKILGMYKEDMTHRGILSYAIKTVFKLGNLLGLSFDYIPKAVSDADIESSIRGRLKAKSEGDYRTADMIREMLKDRNIILEDTEDGKTTWRRKI